MVALVALLAVLLGLTATLRGPYFYYIGDNPESFVPLWAHFGQELRAGRWLQMEASGWMGGNYAGEAAYAQWNPLMLANYVMVSLFNNLAIAAALVMIELMTLLAVAVYLLARQYGAKRAAAIAVALAMPVSGFTLFYEAAGWPAGLSAFVGVAFFWWAVKKQIQDQTPPILTVVIGLLAITTGNPYALLGILVVLLAAFVELLLARDLRTAVQLVITGLLVGSGALLVFLPLLGVQSVTLRQELALIKNDTFLVPDLGDLAAASTPSYLPSILNWEGAVIEQLPSIYLAWFVLPLLPWIRWRRMVQRIRGRVSLLVMTVIFAAASLGPSNLWLFRWPLRLIEYFYLAVLIGFAVAISAGAATTHRRTRYLASAGIVAVGAYLSFAVLPQGWMKHGAGLVLTVALLALAIAALRRHGQAGLAMVAIGGTVLVTAFQVLSFPSLSTPKSRPAYDLAVMAENSSSYGNSVLQLAHQSAARTKAPEDPNNLLLYGNLTAPLRYESVNRYTGIGFRSFADALCMDYKGQTCPDAPRRLQQPVAGTTGTLLDALRVDTLVLQNSLYPRDVRFRPPPGWAVADTDKVRTVWKRTSPVSYPGRVSGVSAGTTVRSSTSSETAETATVVGGSNGGLVTFARLGWPGYNVTVDGQPVAATTTEQGLLQIAVPAGEHQVRLSYTTPGLTAGFAAVGVALLLALGQSVLWWRARLRRRARSAVRVEEPLPVRAAG